MERTNVKGGIVGMVTEKFDLFCQKRTELPSIRYGYGANGEKSFDEWYNNLSPEPELHEHYLSKMMQFAFTGINQSRNFYVLKNDVITEINENIKSFINPYQFEQYFIYLNQAINQFHRMIQIYIQDLNQVSFHEYTTDEIKALEPQKKASFLIFNVFSVEIESCLNCYVDLKSYVEQQQILYGNKKEITDNAFSEIAKFSDKTAHKILLLHELGIIEYLQKEYFHPSQTDRNGTDLANIIANIISEPTKGETIRKNISGILSRGKDNIMTKSAVAEVKKFLITFNIPLKRIKDKD